MVRLVAIIIVTQQLTTVARVAAESFNNTSFARLLAIVGVVNFEVEVRETLAHTACFDVLGPIA